MDSIFKMGLDDCIVNTTKGKVKGFFHDGINVFRGIPYATAKRFHSPSEVTPWDGIKDATVYGFTCPNFGDGIPREDVIVPHRYWPANEDCLNLNVWTPGLDNKKRPVIVWFHGGGFVNGSAIEQVSYDGKNMAQNGDLVVVSVNHRLNLLGYLDCSSFGEEYKNSANAGNEDLLYSLKWVKANIEAFGGDSNNVTILGQSGGGMKVTSMLQCPEADGYYNKAIIMSGVMDPRMVNENPDNGKLVQRIIDELKLNNIKELETVPYKHLVKAYLKVRDEFEKKHLYVGCNPAINYFYKGNPLQVGFREEVKDVPIILSSVISEFGHMFPFPLKHNVTSDEQAIQIVSSMFGKENTDRLVELFRKAYPSNKLCDLIAYDYIFRPTNLSYVLERSKISNNNYLCMFTSDLNVNGGILPSHCVDIPFVFHNIDLVPSTSTIKDSNKLQEEIFASINSFVRTGNPSNKLIGKWNPVEKGNINTMMFGNNTKQLVNHDVDYIFTLQAMIMPVILDIMEKNNIRF